MGYEYIVYSTGVGFGKDVVISNDIMDLNGLWLMTQGRLERFEQYLNLFLYHQPYCKNSTSWTNLSLGKLYPLS